METGWKMFLLVALQGTRDNYTFKRKTVNLKKGMKKLLINSSTLKT
jgi:hypothetical protein